MPVDLVLRGGTVCDGSGRPAETGDVAIAGGRIAQVGRFDGSARRSLDASGLVVAPGFVDVHTHYDAQVTWDALCTPSCWHGVTSVVLGNCGFALAPCRAADRERVLRMLEHVEGMPYASLRAGVAWEWESIPEYLKMLERRRLGLNVGVLLGHSTIRAYVLGDDAYQRGATAAEIAEMSAIVREGMAAGGLGLATSLSPGHVGEGGRPVPSRLAGRQEIRALASTMAESGRGLVEVTPETFPLSPGELAELEVLATATGRPVCFSAILDLPRRDHVWDPVFAGLRAAAARGARIVPQVSCRPMRFDFDLETGCASLDAVPCWRRFRGAPSRPERLALLDDPDFRALFRSQTLGRLDSPSSDRWASVVLEQAALPSYVRYVGFRLAEIAAERGGDVVDALFELGGDPAARFSMLLLNYDEERVAEILRQPESLIALSDAGAHVSILCDAGYATHLLGHWVRDRRLFLWEEAVRRLTSMPAEIYGLTGRGRLVPGAAADVTCFDPTTVAMLPPERVDDFPGGATRTIARAAGIEHVFIAGEEFLAGGEWTGATPGRLLGGG